MLLPRIIPVLLVHKGGLVKTTQFKNPKYVGDPINAVKIFNEKIVDELAIIDIDATTQDNSIDFNLIKNLASECRMPMSYGGGVKNIEQIEKIISLGVEKILISSAVVANPELIREAAERVGSQSIVVVLDVSGSMKAADFRPKDRLHVAKEIIKKHLLTRRNDRIGLVVFAGQAYTQAPLTHDKELLAEILDGVRTGVIEDGTAIGDATATGVNRLRESKAKGKALILITDGDNNAGRIAPLKAADLAKSFNVQIFSILVGKGGKGVKGCWASTTGC